LVHCRSYLASLTGLYLKINKGIPFVFDMRGFWADERIDGGIWKKANVLHRVFYTYFKQKEKQFFEHANAVVSLTNAGLEVMQRNFPDSVLSKKTTVIPCCTNTNLFIRKPYLEQKNRLNVKEGEHVIVYTGSIGTWYYTKEMIDCMIVWKKHIPNLKLLVLTKDTEVLKNLLNTYSAEQQSIVISAAASYKEVANYLSLANAAIFFIKPAPSKTASSPTKMAECWALDLPIITNAGIGDNDLYFGKYQGGILLKEFNTEAYEQACRDYISLSNTSGHYRKIAVDFFDLKMGIEKYTDIYNTLVTN
jgi:glycosyltransferase involved in cell wall biosynthesis